MSENRDKLMAALELQQRFDRLIIDFARITVPSFALSKKVRIPPVSFIWGKTLAQCTRDIQAQILELKRAVFDEQNPMIKRPSP